jgi:Leucine Rich repeat
MQDFSVLDIAVSSHSARKLWLTILKSIKSKAINTWHHSHWSMMWVILRSIRVSNILGDLNHCDRISDTTFEAVGINRSRTLSGEEISGDNIFSRWDEGKYLESIDLSQCDGFTDFGLSALAHRCVQLEKINLSQCDGIADIGLSALGNACRQLRTINLSQCQGITDLGLSALAGGCGQLQTINLSQCDGIADIGLSALAGGMWSAADD